MDTDGPARQHVSQGENSAAVLYRRLGAAIHRLFSRVVQEFSGGAAYDAGIMRRAVDADPFKGPGIFPAAVVGNVRSRGFAGVAYRNGFICRTAGYLFIRPFRSVSDGSQRRKIENLQTALRRRSYGSHDDWFYGVF